MSKGAYIGVYQDATNTAINTVLKPEHVGTYVSLSQRNGGFTHASDGTLTSTTCEDGSNVRCVINFSSLATKSGYGYDEKFTLKIDWAVSSESGYDFFSIYDNTTSEVYVEASGSKSGSITLTVYPTTIIVAQYEKDSSGKSGNDQGTLKMTLSGGQSNIPAGSYARRVISMYIGVNNIARRVRKGYIGVNGIARLFYATPGLYRAGSVVALSPVRDGSTAGSIGNYAVFSGGNSAQTEGTYWESKVTEYYNTSLTKATATSLSYQVGNHAAAANSSYLFITGGLSTATDEDETQTYRTTVNTYNSSMTKSTATALSGTRQKLMYGNTSNKTYAIFAGGTHPEANRLLVNYYNTSKTRTVGSNLTSVQGSVRGVNVGNYCIFGGGENPTFTNNVAVDTVIAYNNSMTRTTCTSLTPGRQYIATASAGNGTYAILYGGSANNREVTTVDCYNSSLTKVTIPKATVTCSKAGSITLANGWAVFFGGEDLNSNHLKYVEGYDASLTKTRSENMLYSRVCYYSNANFAAKAGESYVVLAGGGMDENYNKPTTAEAYQIIS